MGTEKTHVLYAAKRVNGKWLNKNDPDVKRFLEGGEVPASILAIMSTRNKFDCSNVMNQMRFEFPTGDDVEEDDFHVIADPSKYFRARPLKTRVEPERPIPVWNDMLASILMGFVLYYIFIRGNAPICLAEDQWCASRTVSILLSFLMMAFLSAPPPHQPTTVFMQSKPQRLLLLQAEALKEKFWQRQQRYQSSKVEAALI